MALSSSQLVLGKRVRVAGFTAKVTEDGDYDDNGDLQNETYKNQGLQVRVLDGSGNSHFISLTQLEVEIPFTDGGLYLSAGGKFYFYVADPDGKKGTWRLRLEDGSKGTTVRSFTTPTRPVQLVTLGETVTE